MLDKNEIVEIADHILNTIATTYNEHEVSLPLRRYLAVGGQGDTVHDCEQLTVSFEQGYSGSPGNQAMEPAKCDSIRTAVFIVEIVRCIPTINSEKPSAQTATPSRWDSVVNNAVQTIPVEVLTAVAKTQMVDAMLLMDAGMRAGDNTMSSGALVDISVGAPQGGFQAIIMTIASAAVTASI